MNPSERTTPITVSFCVPTYNRARYLDSLLESLVVELADFPYSYEIFVSDNASTDETPEVLARHSERLPLRCVRQAENRGGFANFQYLHAHAPGRYIVYVADDDGILGVRVAQIIALMEANPGIGIAYAPWKLLDLVADEEQGQFYYQSQDVVVPRGQYVLLLETILRNRIFPEIYIGRRDVLQAALPRVPEQAFYAFVHAAEFVQRAAVLFVKEPYYVSVTNYFADHQRSQVGHAEAETSWDRYRGGLEFILGRAADQLTPVQRTEFLLHIQAMVAERMGVAVRLRLQANRDAVETYYLAYRLKALGADEVLPAPLQVLRAYAALAFLHTDPELNRDMARLLCVGTFPEQMREQIRRGARLPVAFYTEDDELPPLDASTLLFLQHARIRAALPPDCAARSIDEAALMAKFPG